MKCPVCTSVDLLMAERQGVEIDYCPQCRGIWLDRGELDKIIEKSNVAQPQPQVQPQQTVQPHQQTQPYPQAGMPQPGPQFYPKKHHDDDHHDEHHGMKKKKSFLSEMFDFG